MEKVRVYLDDIRTPIENDWIICRDYDEFVNKVSEIGLEYWIMIIYTKKPDMTVLNG